MVTLPDIKGGVTKPLKPNKSTVELRPSRIRRDPVANGPLSPTERQLQWFSSRQETWIVVIGVTLFGLALFFLSIGISQITSK